jgi:hypothetical protein
MDMEKVLSSLLPLKVSTRNMETWMFEYNKKYYKVAEYTANFGDRGCPEQTAIWESNKRGKRLTEQCLYQINGKNRVKCIEEFLNTLT